MGRCLLQTEAARLTCITGSQRKIADLLAMPGIADCDFETPRSPDLAKSVDLS
jgi:hypothetical protein